MKNNSLIFLIITSLAYMFFLPSVAIAVEPPNSVAKFEGVVDNQQKMVDLLVSSARGSVEATETLKRSAKNGETFGIIGYAFLKIFGYGGIAKDAEGGIKMIRQIADSGSLEAQNELGNIYSKGYGTPVNADKSFYWFLKSAKNGYPLAQYNIGVAYHEGLGVRRDKVEAMAWLYLSAKNGEEKALYPAEMLKLQLTSSQFIEALKRAEKYEGDFSVHTESSSNPGVHPVDGWWGWDFDKNGCNDVDNQYRVALGKYKQLKRIGSEPGYGIKFGEGSEKIGMYDGGCDLSEKKVIGNRIEYRASCEFEHEKHSGPAIITFIDKDNIYLKTPSFDPESKGIGLVRCDAPSQSLKEEPTSDVQKLIRQQEDLNSQCRGGSGDSPKTLAACESRDKLLEQIHQRGWCWGKEGQAGYERSWVKCKR